MLQTVPGVYIDRLSGGTGHYTTARARGSSAAQVNIYMDGVLVNTGSEQAVNLENINMDNVERIEVYRGYIPARFSGSAIGGAINIVTKKPEKIGGKVSYGMSSFNGYKGGAEVTSPLGDGSLMLSFSREQEKGDFNYHKLMQKDDVISWKIVDGKAVADQVYPLSRWRQNNNYNNNNFFAKWQDKNWFAKINYFDNKSGVPLSVNATMADLPSGTPSYGSTLYDVPGGWIHTQKTEAVFGRRQQHGNLEWGWKLGSSYQHKTASYLGVSPLGYNTKGETNFRNRSYTATIDGSYKLWDSNLFEFLASATKESMDVRFTKGESWAQGGAGWGHDTSMANYFIPHYDMKNYYLQIQDTMYIDQNKTLTFTPLVRAQYSDMGIPYVPKASGDVTKNGADWVYSYNMALKKKFNDQWTASATYGTYYKIPSWYEIYGDGVSLLSRWFYSYTDPYSANTASERGTSWDASVNHTGRMMGSESDTSLTYFHRNARNLMMLFFNPLYGGTWYGTAGAGKIHGLEFSHDMHWKHIDLSLSATWQNSMVTKGNTPGMTSYSSVMEGKPFAWTPKWEYNARIDYRFPNDRLSLFAEYHWTDKLYSYSYNGVYSYYEAMGIINAGMKYKFRHGLQLIAGINDIGNKGPKQLMVDPFASPDTGGGAQYVTKKYNVGYPQQGRTYYATLEYSF